MQGKTSPGVGRGKTPDGEIKEVQRKEENSHLQDRKRGKLPRLFLGG